MRHCRFLVVLAVLSIAVPALAQKQWIVYNSSQRDPNSGSWGIVTGGDYDGRDYKWYGAPAQNVEWNAAGFYDLVPGNAVPVAPNTDQFPLTPGMYSVEQWSPSALPGGVSAWSWVPVEVTYTPNGNQDTGEAATRNPYLHWLPVYNTNHQYTGSALAFPAGAPGEWKQQGSNHVPDSPVCAAGVTTGANVWLKRNSLLYIYWNPFPFSKITRPLTALRLTQIYPGPITVVPVSTGPLDLRAVGNADPLYGVAEPFANNYHRTTAGVTIDGWNALAVGTYDANVCGVLSTSQFPDYWTCTGCDPHAMSATLGLPADGSYVAENVEFKLRYDGLNSIKWRTNDSDYPSSAEFTLQSGREFTPGNYKNVSLLTTGSGGQGHRLTVEAVYAGGGSPESHTFNLYDWGNGLGDANSIAVGLGGYRRAAGNGFQRIAGDGKPGGVDPATLLARDPAFLFVNTAWIDPSKALDQLKLRVDLPWAPNFMVESRGGCTTQTPPRCGNNYANYSEPNGGFQDESYKSHAATWDDRNDPPNPPQIGCRSAGAGSNAIARFSYTPTVTGYYNVFATWGNSLNQPCNSTAFVVYQDGAPAVVMLDQTQRSNEWVQIVPTDVHLTAGTAYSVDIDASQSICTSGSRVYADAVKWESAGMSANVLAVSLNSTPCNIPWADADGDGDVDSADFAVLQACLTTPPGGTPAGPIGAGCRCLNSNGDSQIDVTDLTNFLNCAMGPDVTYTHSPTPPYWPNWPGGSCPGPSCCPGQPSN